MYRIKEICHSGRVGERGTVRREGLYSKRIDRLVRFDDEIIRPGWPIWVEYIEDSDGTPLFGQSLVTSTVVDVYRGGKTITVETLNSIYEFEEEEEA